MFGDKIKLDKDLLERCKKYATEAGYSSVEEFIAHVLEKELRRGEKKDEDERKEVAKKLRGLGYIG
jgi:metal-responsive CopG/Arc/MetJ family transcriptional regulator